MKKAKIMLMAIAVFGIIGGALAFKSSKAFGKPDYCLLTTTSPNSFVQNYTIAPAGAPCSLGFTAITTNPSGAKYTGVFSGTTYYATVAPTTVNFLVGE